MSKSTTLRAQGVALMLLTASAFAQCQAERFESPVGATNEEFGAATAVQGDLALLAQPRFGGFKGAVYVSERSGGVWSTPVALDHGEPPAARHFGHSVDLDGDTAIVGAWADAEHGSQSGAAYIFRKSGGVWTLEAKLSPSDAASNQRFGWDVAIQGDTAMVCRTSQPGGIWVFEHQGGGVWAQVAVLLPGDVGPVDGFGQQFTLRGDTLIAMSNNEQGGTYPGSVYVYRNLAGVWTEEQELSASAPQDGSLFGYTLDVQGDTIVVGSQGFDEFGVNNIGQAYVFRRTGGVWAETQQLRPAWVNSAIGYGVSVALSGDSLLVGASSDFGDGAPYAGSAYSYRYDGDDWGYIKRVFSNPPSAFASFGGAIGLDGDTAVIGASFEGSDTGTADGAAYVIDGFEAEQVTMAVEPTVSYLELWITLPVFGDFHIVIPIVGEVVADVTTECGEPTSVQMLSNDFATEEPVVTLDLGMASFMQFQNSGIHMNDLVGGPGDPSPIDAGGGFSVNPIEQPYGTLAWSFLGIPGSMDMDAQPSDTWAFNGTLAHQGDAWDFVATVEPVVFVLDMGLGANNPTVTYGGHVEAHAGGVCEADCNGDTLVDTRDMLCFLNLWVADDARADCNNDGVIDTRDVICFLNVWVAGC